VAMADGVGMTSAGVFQPNPEELNSTFLVLQALRDPSRPDHVQAMQGLEGFCGNGSFILHLVYVFVRGATVPAPMDIRALSGFILKNYGLVQLQNLPVMVVQMFKSELLGALQDPLSDIQNTAGIIFGKLTKSFSIEIWGDMLPPLFSMLDYQSPEQFVGVDGALHAIKRICEDSCDKLLSKGPVTAANITSPLDVLVPKLLRLFQHPVASIRLKAIQSMNALIFLIAEPTEEEELYSPQQSSSSLSRLGHGREAFIIHINAFLQGISHLAEDPLPEVRLAVCQAIVSLASYQLAVLQPAYESICAFMLNAVRDPTEAVAMEACEFFAVLCDNPDARGTLIRLFPTLLPLLIGHLKLSTEQLTQERADEEAAARGDKDLNIKPIHHKVSNHKSSSQGDDDADNGGNVDSGAWTLRKEAALLMDNISTQFHPDYILPNCLPEIQLKLASTNVWDREAGLLGLGALGTGCIEAMEPYLLTLFPLFLQTIQDEMIEVRAISCWVISRYSGWLFAGNNGETESEERDEAVTHETFRLVQATIRELLKAMTDSAPKVQAAACSALCTVMDYAGETMISFLVETLSTMGHCFQIYGIKSLMTLFDTLGVFADNVGDVLNDPALTPLYMPHIMSKLELFADNDMRLFPVLECLTSVTAVTGHEMVPYAPSLFVRCLRIIMTTMQAYIRTPAQGNNDLDEDEDAPVKDFAICSLDVISGLVEGLGKDFIGLLQAADNAGSGGGTYVLLQALFICLHDSLPECRQSAFSLAGELCKNCPNIFVTTPSTVISSIGLAASQQQQQTTLLHDLILQCINNMVLVDSDATANRCLLVCNNACWTVGELAMQVGGNALSPYIGRILQAHIYLLDYTTSSSSENYHASNLQQNLAITIGRLAITNTQQVTEAMNPECFEEFCKCLQLIPTSVSSNAGSSERDQAFTGLMRMVQLNPQLVFLSESTPRAFIYACASWDEPPQEEELWNQLSTILHAIKVQYTQIWVSVLRSMNAELVSSLLTVFRIN
jgi:hypothetical protein